MIKKSSKPPVFNYPTDFSGVGPDALPPYQPPKDGRLVALQEYAPVPFVFKSGASSRPRPVFRNHITVILGALAAKMWDAGVDELLIEHHMRQSFKKYTRSLESKVPKVSREFGGA